MNDSEELQSIVTALEADKESCQFLIQVRKVFADISSIPLKETYLDMLPVELSKLNFLKKSKKANFICISQQFMEKTPLEKCLYRAISVMSSRILESYTQVILLTS